MYLSVVTGYLIAAYLAGSKLKQSQASLINTFFVVSAFYFSWSTFINNMAVTIFQLQMERVPNFLLYAVGALNLAILVTMVAGVFACLRFMKDARRESGNESDET